MLLSQWLPIRRHLVVSLDIVTAFKISFLLICYEEMEFLSPDHMKESVVGATILKVLMNLLRATYITYCATLYSATSLLLKEMSVFFKQGDIFLVPGLNTFQQAFELWLLSLFWENEKLLQRKWSVIVCISRYIKLTFFKPWNGGIIFLAKWTLNLCTHCHQDTQCLMSRLSVRGLLYWGCLNFELWILRTLYPKLTRNFLVVWKP